MHNTYISLLQSMTGVVVGGFVTYFSNYKLYEKKLKNDKEKILFENNINILRKMKINNLEVLSKLENRIGVKLKDHNKSSINEHIEFIASLTFHSYENFKLLYELLYSKVDTDKLKNSIESLHLKMLEIQDAIPNNKMNMILTEEAKKLTKAVDKNIDENIEIYLKKTITSL